MLAGQRCPTSSQNLRVGTNLNQANPILLVRGAGLDPPRARDSERSARSRECAGSCNAGRHRQPRVSRWTQSHQNLIEYARIGGVRGCLLWTGGLRSLQPLGLTVGRGDTHKEHHAVESVVSDQCQPDSASWGSGERPCCGRPRVGVGSIRTGTATLHLPPHDNLPHLATPANSEDWGTENGWSQNGVSGIHALKTRDRIGAAVRMVGVGGGRTERPSHSEEKQRRRHASRI